MKSSLLVGSLVAALLSGCVVAPVPDSRPYYGEAIMVAPPPPRIEYVGPPPVVGQIWIGGYWLWAGRRHEWVPGRWENPRPGYGWVPHRWERDGDRWRQNGGRWERQRDSRDERHEHRDWH